MAPEIANTSELILVTGASGLLGGHIVDVLLKEGYRARVVVRKPKESLLQKRYEQFGDRVELVVVDDFVTGDFTTALKGTHALIHAASPLPGHMNCKDTIDAAVKGTTNIVSQAAKAGVTKIVVTSSVIAAAFELSAFLNIGKLTEPKPGLIGPDTWSDISEELALEHSDNWAIAYSASKTLAERALWALAAEHPELDVTTILPPYMYGPFAPGSKFAKGGDKSFSSNRVIYRLLTSSPAEAWPNMPIASYVDVRDCARAHVLALRAPPSAQQKRLFVAAGRFAWSDVIDHLKKEKPALADRLPDPQSSPNGSRVSRQVFDTSLAKEVLGLDSYTPWQTSIGDAVDDIIRMMTEWEAEG